MSKTVTVLLAVVLSTVACASDKTDEASPGQAGASPLATPAKAETAGADAGQPSDVIAACSAWFDAFAARKARCGDGIVDFPVGAQEKPLALAACAARLKRAGTGYTNAFYEGCGAAAQTAACDDQATMVAACSEPRGSLTRDMPCNTDDQCSDGYCKIPDGAKPGSTCGTCAVPVWVEQGDKCKDVENAKCRPGLTCYDNCTPLWSDRRGTKCDAYSGCPWAYTCDNGACVRGPIYKEGEKWMSTGACEPGTSNVQGTCVRDAVAGEACGYDPKPRCSGWLVCRVGRCEAPEDLTCN